MKTTFILLAGIAFAAIGIAAGIARQPSARQPAERRSSQPQSAQYLIVSFYEGYDIGGKSRMVEVHEDGSHQITVLKWKVPVTFDRKVAHEDSVMAHLKAFFDQGWSLVSVNNEDLGTSYYLRKEQ